MRPELDETQAAEASSDQTATVQGKRATSASGELVGGMRLGHFRIDRLLGAGGMGEVYLATDLALDRRVAIKVLPAGVVSGSARDRLIREARAQARVHHPHVAHIYFIGEEDGRLYFAMEHVAGKTLADRIAEGPLPVEDALAMIRAAALGLREAQRSGFTHRDVKPSNLMVDGHGVLKVLDFGLAAGSPEVPAEAARGTAPVAQTTLGGTPLYMAPEQARGEPIDFRADIYALGATLYHLVSGRPPFQADTIDELVTMHAGAPRPPLPRGANTRSSVAAVSRLIERMMAPRAQDRFTSYDELLQALEVASATHTRPAGFWVRSIATAIDLAVIGLGTAVITELLIGHGDVRETLTLVLIALIATATIARWGTTPGKALFELEVVSIVTSARPTWGQAARREGAMVSLPLAMDVLGSINHAASKPVPSDIFSILGAVAMVLLVIHLLYSALRSPGKRTVWDRVSGTMVRYRTRRAPAGTMS